MPTVFTLHCSVAAGSNSTAATGNTSGMSTFIIHVYILRPVPTWPICGQQTPILGQFLSADSSGTRLLNIGAVSPLSQNQW